MHSRLDVGHHVGVRVEPDAALGLHSHDAVVRSSRLHQRAAATTVYAAPGRGAEGRRRLLTGTQRTPAVRQSIQEGEIDLALSPFCFPCVFVYMFLCIRSLFILHFLIVSFLYICICTFIQLCNVNCHCVGLHACIRFY